MFLAAIICQATIVINLSGDPWNKKDDQTLNRASYVCYTEYAPEFPCVKIFTKKEERDYEVICGAAK